MQIVFKPRAAQAAALRDLALDRVRFALRRLSTVVPHATVQLSDVNGPRGGIDKRCQVHLRTDGAGVVVVDAVAADWRTAIDRALARAQRLLLRLSQRGHGPARATRRLQLVAADTAAE